MTSSFLTTKFPQILNNSRSSSKQWVDKRQLWERSPNGQNPGEKFEYILQFQNFVIIFPCDLGKPFTKLFKFGLFFRKLFALSRQKSQNPKQPHLFHFTNKYYALNKRRRRFVFFLWIIFLRVLEDFLKIVLNYPTL